MSKASERLKGKSLQDLARELAPVDGMLACLFVPGGAGKGQPAPPELWRCRACRTTADQSKRCPSCGGRSLQVVTRELRALSVRQPWAWMIVHGGKDVENRVWDRSWPEGPFLIHASKGMTHAEYVAAVDFATEAAPALVVPPPAALLFGGVIGAARIVGVLRPHSTARGTTQTAIREAYAQPAYRWWAPDQFGYQLTDVRPLPFDACAGALGFFRPDMAVGQRALARMTEGGK